METHMALSNAQYDEIMRGYNQRQIRNKHITSKRINEAYTKCPQLKAIDDAMIKYPDLVKKYFGKIVNNNENKFSGYVCRDGADA